MFLVLGVSSLGLVACTGSVDDIINAVNDECLTTGEFCDTAYKEGTYGNSSISCCGSINTCTTRAGDSRPTCN